MNKNPLKDALRTCLYVHGGEYLEQWTETVHRLTKGVKVRASVGTKQRHNQNNHVGVVLQGNEFVNRDTMVYGMQSECNG